MADKHQCSQSEKISFLDFSSKQMSIDISEIKGMVKDTNTTMQHNHNTVMTMFTKWEEKFEKKYASKWVEWIIKGLIGITGAIVVGAMVKDILK